MAVLEEFQGLGLGEKLMLNCEETLTSVEETLLWFNARESAVGIYKKLGYKTIGEIFEIEGVGKHIVMYKIL